MLRPLEAPRGLTGELVARLTADIVSGKLTPGSQLPTEQEMIAATGVSRTVVREAIAALKADRLVVTRQGVGAFVADHVRRPFHVDFDETSPLREVLNVMELRTGIEVEAAGLAAERASAAQIKKIGDRLAAIRGAIEKGGNAVDQDFAFHCEIADATGNPQFKRFLEYLGRFVIPRRTVWGRPRRPPSARISICSSVSTKKYSPPSATAPWSRPAAPCSGICSTAATATRSSWRKRNKSS